VMQTADGVFQAGAAEKIVTLRPADFFNFP
jgi:hypothetical protein